MKKLFVILSGLMMLPAFAEVAPIFYDEVAEEQAVEEMPVGEVATKEVKVIAPVVQPSRVSPRGASDAVRSGRQATAQTKNVNARNVATRNATTARTATSRNAVTARAGAQVATNGRVASRSARGVTTQNTKAVTSRSVAASNAGRTARAATAVVVSDNTPLYNANARIGMRASNAMRARMPSSLTISSASSGVTSTEEKQEALINMDEVAQMTDYCKAQYISCMDNFCNVLDDNQGRCSCSKNIKNYEKTEAALKSATEALQDVSQQIQYIGLTADDIETLFTQTEAEIALQSTTDSTQLKNDLDNIKDMIVGIKTGTATSSETDMSFDLSGMLDFNIDSTGFDLTGMFAGSTANTSSISNQRGEQLYKTAAARCKAAVLTSCQSQGVDIAVITNAYDLEIDRQCVAYERALTDANDSMERTVRNAKIVLQKARLMVSQQKNAYDLRGCVNALDSCMQDDFVCGTDYENCLDPTGKYIVNGAVVIGSAPGYFVNESEASSALSPAPIQHTTGLYKTWDYANTAGQNAWYTSDAGKPSTLAGYIVDSISQDAVTETDENLVRFLQYKIGYVANNRTYGMCASVLNKCQNYTYDDGKFLNDNQVVREYLQRTLTQIKVAQDEIIGSYAENCISDVSSCLSSNNYAAGRENFAINACKAQIVTCMSVNGDATQTPTPNTMLQWVNTIQGVSYPANNNNSNTGQEGADGGAQAVNRLKIFVADEISDQITVHSETVECSLRDTVHVRPNFTLNSGTDPNFDFKNRLCDSDGSNCAIISNYTVTPERCAQMTGVTLTAGNGGTCKNCNTIDVQYDGVSFVSGSKAYCNTDRPTLIIAGDYLTISDQTAAENAEFAEELLDGGYQIQIKKGDTVVFESEDGKFNNQIDPKYCDGQHTIHVWH